MADRIGSGARARGDRLRRVLARVRPRTAVEAVQAGHDLSHFGRDVKWLLAHAQGIQKRYEAMRAASRHVLVRLATPKWSERSAIDTVYRNAALLSEQYGVDLEVDHVVPIKSKLVCGLHVHANLQLLDQSLNASKGNRWWPDMP